jgi:hypothetical protein
MALLGDISQTLAAVAQRLAELVDKKKVGPARCARCTTARGQGSDANGILAEARPDRSAPTPRCWRRSTRCLRTRSSPAIPMATFGRVRIS